MNNKTLMTDFYDDESHCQGHCGLCEQCEEALYQEADDFHDNWED